MANRVGPAMQLRDRPEFATKAKPLTGTADETVASAVAKMSEKNYGSVFVVDAGERVLGVVTERDLMRRVLNEGRDPQTTTLGDIMTPDVRVARETDDLLDWLRLMSNERFRRLPIVDADGKLIAVMTQGDFVSYTWPDLIYQARQLATATISRNYQFFLIGGGVLLYALAMVVLIRSI